MPASTTPDRPSCSAPRPNTSLRRRDRRSNDSSSPIMKSRKTTPNSAIASILWTWSSAQKESTAEPCATRPSP
jgi:hypothetical protein